MTVAHIISTGMTIIVCMFIYNMPLKKNFPLVFCTYISMANHGNCTQNTTWIRIYDVVQFNRRVFDLHCKHKRSILQHYKVYAYNETERIDMQCHAVVRICII